MIKLATSTDTFTTIKLWPAECSQFSPLRGQIFHQNPPCGAFHFKVQNYTFGRWNLTKRNTAHSIGLIKSPRIDFHNSGNRKETRNKSSRAHLFATFRGCLMKNEVEYAYFITATILYWKQEAPTSYDKRNKVSGGYHFPVKTQSHVRLFSPAKPKFTT